MKRLSGKFHPTRRRESGTKKRNGLIVIPDGLFELEVEEKKPDAETGQNQQREQAGANATAASSRGGKLGVVPAEVTPIIANLLKMDEVQGIMVTAVYADSVASRAGVKKGDVILKYGDKVVNTDPELRGAIRDTPPGTTVPITIWRNGSEIILSARF